jgi:hypothetical protein
LSDGNDPAHQLKLFETIKALGKELEDIWNEPEFAEEHGEWLGKYP